MSLKDFYNQLELTPNDWELRGVFADWLYENNEPELEKAQRWLIEHEKYPSRIVMSAPFGEIRYIFVNYKTQIYQVSQIPDRIFAKLDIIVGLSDFFSLFHSMEQAERNLGIALLY